VQLWPDSRLDLVLLLALLQVAWWPPESVGKGLDASLVFDQQPGLRRLWSNGKLVLEVGYTGEYFSAGCYAYRIAGETSGLLLEDDWLPSGPARVGRARHLARGAGGLCGV
jgi:hypothetical protein